MDGIESVLLRPGGEYVTINDLELALFVTRPEPINRPREITIPPRSKVKVIYYLRGKNGLVALQILEAPGLDPAQIIGRFLAPKNDFMEATGLVGELAQNWSLARGQKAV